MRSKHGIGHCEVAKGHTYEWELTRGYECAVVTTECVMAAFMNCLDEPLTPGMSETQIVLSRMTSQNSLMNFGHWTTPKEF